MTKEELYRKLDEWVESGDLLKAAKCNAKTWLGSDWYAEFHDEVAAMVEAGDVRGLNDGFWTIIPFGTGGRRGTMGVGPNRINRRTIGESAQGLATYIVSQGEDAMKRGCAIAFDTRHRSDEFARLVAEILAGNGVRVFLFDSFRSTPELSYAVRHTGAVAGVMLTASHNPPSDNGFKAYWEDGAQVVPPHDTAIIAEVQRVGEIRTKALDAAEAEGLVVRIGSDVDEPYIDKVCALSLSGEREIGFVYTPLHGTGTSCVVPALERLGFAGMKVYAEQATPDGDFPNVPDHKPNPEDPAAMGPAVEYAESQGCTLVIASDPDADRLAVAYRDKAGKWTHLNGNQVGVLLTHYTLDRLRDRGDLPADGYIVRTVVSTVMADRVAESFGIEAFNDLLVGFKYIAETIRDTPGRPFLFGFEESIGYLRAGFVRDKDATQAAVLLVELAARLQAQGKTLGDRMDDLYREYGYYREVQKSFYLEGAEGSRKMEAIMKAFRDNPPLEIAGHRVVEIIDRKAGESFRPGSAVRQPVSGTKGNVLIFVLSDDRETRVSIRPSGTEPKLKHYIATSGRMDDGFSSLAALKTMVDQKAKDILEDIIEIEQKLAEGA